MGYFPKKHIVKRKVFSDENAWTRVQVKSFDVNVFFVKYLSVANYLFVVFLNINQLNLQLWQSRGEGVGWIGGGGGGFEVELRNIEVKLMWLVVVVVVVGGWWYQRISVTVRLRLRCFLCLNFFFGVVKVDLVNNIITVFLRRKSKCVFHSAGWTGILNGFWKRTINTWSI